MGFEELLEEGHNRPLEMDMSEILLESLRWGGVRIFWRGVCEKGGSDEPPLVTGLYNTKACTFARNYKAVYACLLALLQNSHA